jgi:hypothetical protein
VPRTTSLPLRATATSKLFSDWLQNPAVLGEFRKLLAPSAQHPLDLDLLREEFEAAEWSADFALCPFDVLIKRMVAAFYRAVAEEPKLREVIQIDLLQQLAERMGAWEYLMQRQVATGEQAVDHLGRIRRLTERLVLEQGDTNELLQCILQVLTQANQPEAAIKYLGKSNLVF